MAVVPLALPVPVTGRLIVPEVLASHVDGRGVAWARREIVPLDAPRRVPTGSYVAATFGPTGLLVDVYG